MNTYIVIYHYVGSLIIWHLSTKILNEHLLCLILLLYEYSCRDNEFCLIYLLFICINLKYLKKEMGKKNKYFQIFIRKLWDIRKKFTKKCQTICQVIRWLDLVLRIIFYRRFRSIRVWYTCKVVFRFGFRFLSIIQNDW